MRGPNLFVIGAMKSGTTSLDAYLGAHPSIFMAPSKEPTHFVDGNELKRVSRAIWQLGYWSDRQRYLDEFVGARDETVLGEASTNYSKLPQITRVAERIVEFNPDARIVYIMRDPVERTISHYWHNAKYHDERRDIAEAVKRDAHYREVSHYAMQIKPFIDAFGSDRVRMLTLEAMRDDVLGTLRDLYGWLGVDPDFIPPDLERHNVTESDVVSAYRFPFLRRVRYWRHWRRVRPYVPEPLLVVGKRLAERTRSRNDADVARAVEYLRPIHEAETRELEALLGRRFPEWTTVHQPTG